MHNQSSFFTNLLLYLMIGIFVFPLLYLLLHSFAFGWRWPDLFPQEITARAWQVLRQEPQLMPSLVETLLIGGAVVVLNLLIALPAGKALAHYTFPGKAPLETLIMLPIIIPGLAMAMGLQLSMLRVGMANHWLGVVLVHLIPTVPYSLRIAKAGFESWGIKWEEQARILGVPGWRIFWTLWLPLLLPSLRSMIALTFVISLSQYALTALIGGGNVLTLAMIYFPYFSGSDPAVVAAFSMVFAILPIMFLLVAELMIRLLIPKNYRLREEV